MSFKSVILLIIIIIVKSQILLSQSVKNYLKIADNAFEEKNYNISYIYYKKVLEISKSYEVAYNYAESCRMINDFEEAETWYKYVLNDKNKDKYPLIKFWLGIVEKNLGAYQKAQKYFNEYYIKHKNINDYYSLKSKHEINSCENAIYLGFNPKNVDVYRLNTNINTSFSEFYATDFNDSVLYYSSYHPVNKEDSINFTSKIFKSIKKDTSWINPQIIDTIINKRNYHIANFSFSSNFNTLYFSVSDIQNKTSKIYRSKQINNNWQAPELLPESINKNGAYTTQPSLAKFKGREYLLFVSDRKEGYGKFDIWYCEIKKNGSFGDVKNMGNIINSIDNEVTPFFNNVDTSLYFSSEWYDNFGGYDIFKSKGDFVTWNKPENIGIPINSINNDLYYSLNYDYSKAYFSSNRSSTKSGKNETCCNDIYFIKLKNPQNDSINKVKIITTQIKSIKQLVPITLYFHNDEPNPRCNDTITTLNYESTINKYLAMTEIYRQEYSNGLKGEKKEKSIEDIDLFFMNEVESGYNDLKKFSVLLENLLKTGQTIIITLKGYTSPLNTAEYNFNLAKRRISSLINYFNEYNNGKLKQYIKSGQLKFELIAYGKTLANKNVSDDPKDQRNSVYSPAASLERKIQIIAVSVNEK